MNILLITATIQGMYREIEGELIAQGHSVTIITDRALRFDPYFARKDILRPLKRIIWPLVASRYWVHKIEEHRLAEQRFDTCMIITGTSVSDYLIDFLRENNAGIKIVYYTWDSCSYYSYDRFLGICDKCFSFDIDDTISDSRWQLLPIFCNVKKDESAEKQKDYQYDIMMVGSNHDGRYSFLKKLKPQWESNNLSVYIKVIGPEQNLSLRDRIKLLFLRRDEASRIKEEVAFSKGLENNDLLSHDLIPISEYYRIAMASRCILDDQRDGQSGLTARFIWALAMGKKIITTNLSARKYRFVDQKQVCYIDKENPELPLPFIDGPEEEYDTDVDGIRLAEWVKTLLS